VFSAVYGWSAAALSAFYGWLVVHYDFFHDFAAPAATITAAAATFTAAIVATRITLKFSRIQAEIARQQANTASDRLRLDLFQKRYAIYQAAQELIKLLEDKIPSRTLQINEVTEKLIILDEAAFYFPRDIQEYLNTLGEECQNWVSQHRQRDADGPGSPSWHSSSREMIDTLRRMNERRRSMPKIFEPVMGFSHLTRGSKVSSDAR